MYEIQVIDYTSTMRTVPNSIALFVSRGIGDGNIYRKSSAVATVVAPQHHTTTGTHTHTHISPTLQ